MRISRLFAVALLFGVSACGGGGSAGGIGPIGSGGIVATNPPSATSAPVSTTAPGGTAAPVATPTPSTVSMTTPTPAPGTTAAATAAPGSTAAPSTAAPSTAAPSTAAPSTAAPSTAAPAATKIGHVFIVVLENESESATYGTGSVATYLNANVKPAGAFLPNYYSTGHVSLDNYISMISGQGPNVDTSADCQIYMDFTSTVVTTNGQAAGAGCVFPTSVPNITDQLKTAGISWKDYDEDMGNDPTRESATCGHPTINSQDGTQSAEDPSSANNNMGDQYATRHDPFMYFHSIIDDTAYCNSHVVNSAQFATDLQSISTTAQYNFYTPNLCDDGHDSPCVTGQSAGGLQDIDAFIRMFVPIVTSSPAFQKDGLLIIVTDEAATTDATACCGETGTATDPLPGLSGMGGGNSGAVLLSPFITPGTVTMMEYNHYSMLESVEDVFGLSHLGFAGVSGLTPFGSDIFTAANAPTNAYRRVIQTGRRGF